MWKLIDKTNSKIPEKGSYSDWKAQLAIEGGHRCVYCCISEGHFGGIRNFHVEHFRPKSIFQALINTYSNLFYICSICNSFKKNDWPAEPKDDDFTYSHYPDPSKTDYSRVLNVESETALVYGSDVAGRYLVERLHLNRPQLIVNRRIGFLVPALTKVQGEIVDLIPSSAEDSDTLNRLVVLLKEIQTFMENLYNANPYTQPDTR